MLRSRLALWLGIFLFPPVGLVLLWMRGNMRIWSRLAGTLGICLVAVLELFYVYGMRVEWNGDMQVQKISFDSRRRHYAQLEENRARQRAEAPRAGSSGSAGSERASKGTAPEKVQPVSYWTDFRGPNRAGVYSETRSPPPGPRQACRVCGNSRSAADMRPSRWARAARTPSNSGATKKR